MFKDFLSLFLQSKCSLCERSTSQVICQDCEKQLKSCQRQNYCQFWPGNLPLFVWGNYQGKLKQAIAALKYDNSPQLGNLLGGYLGEAWLSSSLFFKFRKLIVIPIPLHVKKLQKRGFNQAELIAQTFCQVTGYKLHTQGLKREKETQAMFNLNPQEKINNIQNAFIVDENFKQRYTSQPVLLIDDIYTTGTTVKEAIKVLKAQKILVIGVAAIASPIR